MKLEMLAELNAERAARRPAILVTDTANGEQRLIKAADIAKDPLRAELANHLRMGKSGMVEAGGKRLFLNVYAPTAKLVIIGAVHISQALVPIAQSLGYDVTVVDPRTAFASPERFPDRDMSRLSLHDRFSVIVTKDRRSGPLPWRCPGLPGQDLVLARRRAPPCALPTAAQETNNFLQGSAARNRFCSLARSACRTLGGQSTAA